MTRFDELLDDPDFRGMDIEGQAKIRAWYLTDVIGKDADFLSLPASSREGIARAVYEHNPVFSSPETSKMAMEVLGWRDELKKLTALKGTLAPGSPEMAEATTKVKSALDYYTALRTGEHIWSAKAARWAGSGLFELFGGEASGATSLEADTAEGDKAKYIMAKSLTDAGVKLEGMELGLGAINLVTSMAESMAITGPLVGTGSVILKGGELALKGGLFTQRMFNGLAKAASLAGAGGLKATMLARVLPNMVASTFSGVLFASSDILKNLTESRPLEMERIAKTFGDGFLTDMAIWAGTDILFPLLRGMRKSYGSLGLSRATMAEMGEDLVAKMKSGDIKSFTDLFSDGLYQAQSDAAKKGMMRAFQKTASLFSDLAYTPGTLKYQKGLLAQMGFETIAESGGKYTLRSIRVPELSRTFDDLASGALWAKGQSDSIVANLTTYGLPIEDAAIEMYSQTLTAAKTTKSTLTKKLYSDDIAHAIAPVMGDTRTTVTGLQMVADQLALRKVEVPFKIKSVEELTPELKADPKILAVPKILKNADEETAFYQYVKAKFGPLAKGVDKVFDGAIAKIPFIGVSPYGAKTLADLTGSKFEDTGGTVKLDGVEMGLPEATSTMLSKAVRQGVLTDRDLAVMLENTTGLSVKMVPETFDSGISGKLKEPLTRDVWTVRRGSNIVHQSTDPATLIKNFPELTYKIPNRLVPSLIYDPSAQSVTRNSVVASGPLSSLSKVMKDYDTLGDRGPTVSSSPAGSVHKIPDADSSFTVQVNSTGQIREFDTLKEATTWLEESSDSLDEMKMLALTKGVIAWESDPSGGLRAELDDHSTMVFKNLDEIAMWLKDRPDFRTYVDMVGEQTAEVQEIRRRAANAIDAQFDARIKRSPSDGKIYMRKANGEWKLASERKAAKIERKLDPTAPGNGLKDDMTNAFFSPVHYLEARAKRTGDYSAVQKYQQFTNVARAIDVEDRKWLPLAARAEFPVGGKRALNPNERAAVYHLMRQPEEYRAQVAKSLGFKYGDGSETALRIKGSIDKLEEAYNYMGQKFGIDMQQWLTNYGPKLREQIDILKKSKQPFTMTDVMSKAFGGGANPTIKFLAEHSRIDPLLDVLKENDPIKELQYYIHMGNRKQIGATFYDEVEEFSKNLVSQAQRNGSANGIHEAMRMAELVKDELGIDADYTTTVLRSMGDHAHEINQTVLDRMAGAGHKAKADTFFGRMARGHEGKASTSPTRFLNRMQTLASQGLRPFISLRQTLQMNFTAAVLGDEIAIASYKEVSLDPAKYVAKYADMGALGTDLQALSKDAQLSEYIMRNTRNADTMARAATALASETLLDRTLARFQKGEITTMTDFFMYSGHDVLDNGQKMAVWDLVQKGQIAGAKNMAINGMVATTMFDVGRGKVGAAFRGGIGELLGKFGQYSMETIQLYRKLLSNSDPRVKKGRLVRLVYNAAITTGALGALGVNASSFTVLNPLTWGGGPSLDILLSFIEAKNSLLPGEGDDWSSKAGKDLLRKWSQIVPLGGPMSDVIDALQSPDIGQAILNLTGFPLSPDLLDVGR